MTGLYEIHHGSARSLPQVADGSVQAVVTSPPLFCRSICASSMIQRRAIDTYFVQLSNLLVQTFSPCHQFGWSCISATFSTRGCSQTLDKQAGDSWFRYPSMIPGKGNQRSVVNTLRYALNSVIKNFCCLRTGNHFEALPVWIILPKPVGMLPVFGIFTFPQFQQNFGLSPFNTQVGQQEFASLRCVQISCVIGKRRLAVVGFWFFYQDIAAKCFLEHIGNLRCNLAKIDSFAVDGLCGITSNSHVIG